MTLRLSNDVIIIRVLPKNSRENLKFSL